MQALLYNLFLTVILPGIVTGIITCAIAIFRYYEARLPASTLQTLSEVAPIAVSQIEQQFLKVSDPALKKSKKSQAIAVITAIFKHLRIPMPPPEVVDAAVEAAVYALDKTKVLPLATLSTTSH